MTIDLNYQNILRLPYVFNITNSILINENILPNYNVICIDSKYFVKSVNGVIYINDVSTLHNSYKRLKNILDTLICFEKYKERPMELYFNQLKFKKKNIDNDLLKSLQLQYSIDKSYFI